MDAVSPARLAETPLRDPPDLRGRVTMTRTLCRQRHGPLQLQSARRNVRSRTRIGLVGRASQPAESSMLDTDRWANNYAIPIAAALALALLPINAAATPVTTAANIPHSGFAPGAVDMATGEIIIVCRPDLAMGGPMPLEFRRYYGSMIAREGLAAGRLGTNWLGSYDWSLSAGPAGATVVTNRGQRLQFQQVPGAGMMLVSPTDQHYQLRNAGGTWLLTHPSLRRVYAFDGLTGMLSSITDEHGNSLALTYSGGMLAQVGDGLGRTLSFGYDRSGFLNSVSDGTRSVSFAHAGGLLTSVTDAAGHVTGYSYAAQGAFPGLLQSATEPLGNTPAIVWYDAQGRVAAMSDASGSASTCTYDTPTGNSWNDALGNAWGYVHDVQSRLTGLIDPGPISRSFVYDALGRLASVTRPLGDVTTCSYDPVSGLPASVTMGDGSVFAWSYSSHEVLGATFYDVAGATYPDGHSERLTRDAAGNVGDLLDRGRFHWLATYTPRGQVLTTTNPAGGVTTLTYDTQGRLATAADNAGHLTTCACDALDRVTRTTWPDASFRLFAYDALDHLTTFTDERGKVWTYAYDTNGRLASVTDPLLARSTLGYDNADRFTNSTDPLGHVRTLAYNSVGRIASGTDATGNTTRYQYDAGGQLVGVIDPSGAPLQFTYDAKAAFRRCRTRSGARFPSSSTRSIA